MLHRKTRPYLGEAEGRTVMTAIDYVMDARSIYRMNAQ